MTWIFMASVITVLIILITMYAAANFLSANLKIPDFIIGGAFFATFDIFLAYWGMGVGGIPPIYIIIFNAIVVIFCKWIIFVIDLAESNNTKLSISRRKTLLKLLENTSATFALLSTAPLVRDEIKRRG